MIGDSEDVLAARVRELDSQLAHSPAHIDSDATRFIRTVAAITRPAADAPVPVAEATVADQRLARSTLMRRLGDKAPPITRGPIDLTRQYWIATERPPYLPPSPSQT
jgi:hypothetical protein